MPKRSRSRRNGQEDSPTKHRRRSPSFEDTTDVARAIMGLSPEAASNNGYLLAVNF
jgi:hypothetical protein